jgi:hypothetical protein
MPKNAKRTARKPNVDELLNRFAAEENEFLHREFLAPVIERGVKSGEENAVKSGIVRVRIGGALCTVRVRPKNYLGWGVFRPLSFTEAKFVRDASLAERREYLRLFPQMRLIVCHRVGTTWFGSAASFGDPRIQIEGMAPLNLAAEVQLFDSVRVRFDGGQFWFDEADMRSDPATAAYLRATFHELKPPAELQRPGLTAEQKAAYELNYLSVVEPLKKDGETAEESVPGNPLRRRRSKKLGPDEKSADEVQNKLRESLSHAGGQLVDYLERENSYRVRYTVDGSQYTSSVSKGDLSVQVAGICLSGEDQKFDLRSLVGVLREGRGQIVEIGNHGMSEEEYWTIHPPTS